MKIILHKVSTRLLETDKGQLRKVPNYILGLTLFISFNVLFQGIADVAIKLIAYSPVLPEIPWRTDFLFLTAISVLMGYRTYTAMIRKRFDVTRNSIELGVLVETSLIVGDIQFIVQNIDVIPVVLPLRLPFVLLTTLNLLLLCYIYYKLRLRSWWHNT